MRQFLLTFASFFILINSAFSQNFQNREDFIALYDDLYHKIVEKRYKPFTPFDITRSAVYGDGMSYAMMADVMMYENTNDEKYLNNFLKSSYHILSLRRDKNDENAPARWSYDPSMYHDGLIMWAYSHFIYKVKVENLIPLEKDISEVIENDSVRTISDLVDLYISEINKVLDYYDSWWYGKKAGIKTIPKRSARPGHFNFQSAYGATFFYMGMATENEELLQRAKEMAMLYKSVVKDKPRCVSGSPVPPYKKREVWEITEDSCLIWKHWGWRPAKCKNDYNSMTYDDISHGVLVFVFPLTVKNKLNEDSVFFFTDQDLHYMHNTFTKRIFAGYEDGCPQINSRMDGENEINFELKLSGINTLRARVLAYSYLIECDDKFEDKVSEIVVNYINSDCFPKSGAGLTSMDLMGLANLVRYCE